MKIKLFFLTTIITLSIDKNNATESSKVEHPEYTKDFSSEQELYGFDLVTLNNYFAPLNNYIERLNNEIEKLKAHDSDVNEIIKIYSSLYTFLYNIFQKIIQSEKKTNFGEIINNIKSKLQDKNDLIEHLKGQIKKSNIEISEDDINTGYNFFKAFLNRDELTMKKQFVKAKKFKELFVKNGCPTKNEIIEFLQDDNITTEELDLLDKELAKA
jgi:hypothetical protein